MPEWDRWNPNHPRYWHQYRNSGFEVREKQFESSSDEDDGDDTDDETEEDGNFNLEDMIALAHDCSKASREISSCAAPEAGFPEEFNDLWSAKEIDSAVNLPLIPERIEELQTVPSQLDEVMGIDSEEDDFHDDPAGAIVMEYAATVLAIDQQLDHDLDLLAPGIQRLFDYFACKDVCEKLNDTLDDPENQDFSSDDEDDFLESGNEFVSMVHHAERAPWMEGKLDVSSFDTDFAAKTIDGVLPKHGK